MAKFDESAKNNKDGYNRIHDSITRSKTMGQLLKAVEASLQIIKEYKLDSYQQEKLEQYGMRKYDQLLIEERRLASMASHNKFKK